MADKDSDTPAPTVAVTAVAVVGELIKAAHKNSDVKQAGGELGRAALTVAKAVNVCLLPIAAINYGYDRARVYFKDRFQQDMERKLADAPTEEIIEPKPSLAGPVMQGLAFSHDEDALREMYLNLLASAMSKKTASAAHPAFVEIIKQLSAEEAEELCSAMSPPDAKEIVEIRINRPPPQGGWSRLLTHLLPATDTITQQPVEQPNLPTMVDNWIRLGLVQVSYTEWLQDPPGIAANNRYAWAEQRPELQRLRADHLARQQVANTPHEKALVAGIVVAQRGVFKTTAFGEEFSRAVRMDKILTNIMDEARKKAAQSAPSTQV